MAAPPAGERPNQAKIEGIVVPLAFAGDDAALVAALRDNHPGAKATFFQRYAGHVERVITHVIGFDRDLADIIQEVFLNALSSLDSLQDAGALKPWLSRIAAFTARKVLRSRTRRAWLRLFVDAEEEARWDPPSTSPEPESVGAVRAVYAILDRLPNDERIAFALRFIEGMQVEEVAAACAVSQSTAKRRLSRAERRFTALAGRHPELATWLRESTRWQTL